VHLPEVWSNSPPSARYPLFSGELPELWDKNGKKIKKLRRTECQILRGEVLIQQL
jgi:hypothetical protein